MKILVSYRGIPQSPGWAVGDMVITALRDLGHEAHPYAKYYQKNDWVKTRPMLDDHDWDLILYVECNDADQQYTELRITRARKTACWLFDTSYHEDRYQSLVNYFGFDHLFLANPLTIQQYKVWGYKNVHYLPYASDSKLHVRSLEHPKTHDVVLVGSVRDDRRTLIAQLREGGINAELIGGKFREEYIDTLAAARVVVNQNPEIGRGLLNMRFFEAQSAGAILLTEDSDRQHNHLVSLEKATEGSIGYDSMNDLMFLAREALEDSEGRQKHCEWAQTNILTNHTYHNRCQQILETVFSNERNRQY
jgi:spore maturation protein CgeB